MSKTGQEWEYKVVNWDNAEDKWDLTETKLNVLGSDGWEMVTAVYHNYGRHDETYQSGKTYFKRPKNQLAPSAVASPKRHILLAP